MFLHSGKLKQKKIALVLAPVILCLILYKALIIYQVTSLKNIAGRLRQKKKELSEYRYDANNLAQMEKKKILLEEKVADIENLIIFEAEISKTIENISKEANDYGIKIMSIKPDSNTLSEVKLAVSPGFKVYRLPIKLEMISGYHELGRFVGFIENNPFLGVKALSIKNNKADSARHLVSITINANVTKK